MIDTYVVVDCETTGLSPKTEKLIEIGAVKVVNGRVVDTFQELINPGRVLGERVVELTGITNEELAQAEKIGTVLPRFVAFAEGMDLVGHNLMFDYSFLRKACVNANIPFDKKGVDTLRLARVCLPELPSKKLGDLCMYFGIPLKPHRALADAEATQLLLERLQKEYWKEDGTEKEKKLFLPVDLCYKVKKEGLASKRQKQLLMEYAAKKGITLDYDIEELTRNEASRQYDLLISTYGRL